MDSIIAMWHSQCQQCSLPLRYAQVLSLYLLRGTVKRATKIFMQEKTLQKEIKRYVAHLLQLCQCAHSFSSWSLLSRYPAAQGLEEEDQQVPKATKEELPGCQKPGIGTEEMGAME